MNIKRIIAWALLILGLLGIIFSVDALHRISQAKDFVDKVSDFFQHNPSLWNPIVTFFGGKAQEEVVSYKGPVIAFLIVSIMITIAGAWMVIVQRKKTL